MHNASSSKWKLAVRKVSQNGSKLVWQPPKSLFIDTEPVDDWIAVAVGLAGCAG